MVEVDILILTLDILGSGVAGFAFAKEIKRDFEKVIAIGLLVPLILFTLMLLPSAIRSPDEFINTFLTQFLTLVIGIAVGNISAAITGSIGAAMKSAIRSR